MDHGAHAGDPDVSRLPTSRPAPRSTTWSATASRTTSRCKDGDIVNIDVTLILDGWHGDSSRMYAVGEIPRRAERLIEVTYEAMMRGIAAIRPGATTGDIGAAIQTFVEPQHMSVVRDFCGHGLGRLFHDEPNIVHFGRPGEGVVLKPGMLFTVEPMINLGRPHVKVLSDGWTAVTRDRSLSAQFEHTVGVTETASRFSRFAARPRQAAVQRGLTLAARIAIRVTASWRHCPDARLHPRSAGANAIASHAGETASRLCRARRGAAALSRPSRAAARAVPRGRRRRARRLRAARTDPVPRHPAARREAARQGR